MTHSPQVLTSRPSTETLVSAIAAAAEDRKAADLLILKVMEISYLADYFVISTGFSRAQVRAIADSIEKELEEKYQRLPTHTAGQSEGSWILQDYGDVIVHTFMPEERDYYGLESFWGHAQRLTLEDLAALSAG